MARIMGVDLPRNKNIWIALTYIYGIGRYSSKFILEEINVDTSKKVHELTEEEVGKIASVINSGFKVEGDLRREITANIKRLAEIGTYRGQRHKRSLPARGQRTKTNSRTRRKHRLLVR